MLPETECGICYRAYNLGRRCPRKLNCKHAFCEICLSTLARCAESPEPGVPCPLCRYTTPLTGERLLDSLPVDEEIRERLEREGSPVEDEEDTEEPEPEEICPVKEDDSPPPASRKAHLMKRLRKLCRKVTGVSERNCMSDVDLRDLAMMSCYMM